MILVFCTCVKVSEQTSEERKGLLWLMVSVHGPPGSAASEPMYGKAEHHGCVHEVVQTHSLHVRQEAERNRKGAGKDTTLEGMPL
jgi:hypothetical protein